MKNRILCGLVLFLSIVLIIEVSFKKETNFSFSALENKVPEKKTEEKKETEEKIKLLHVDTGAIEEINLEDYIIGVVAAEMPASFEIEALKAQSVASRSYAMYKKMHRKEDYDVRSDISDQAYHTVDQMKSKWQNNFETYYTKIKEAVDSTKNIVLKYNNEIIEAFYFAMSNGYTEDCVSVFQSDLPYLQSVQSNTENESLNNYEVTKTFSKEEFCSLLNISCEEIKIENIEKTTSNRIKSLKINDVEFSGVQVRKLLTLRSTDFDIHVSDQVNITTRGNGHGVGMSQYGANGMAKEGSDWQQILKHYYQNIEILEI